MQWCARGRVTVSSHEGGALSARSHARGECRLTDAVASNRSCLWGCGPVEVLVAVEEPRLPMQGRISSLEINVPSTSMSMPVMSERSFDAFLCGEDTSDAAEAPPGDGACAWSLVLVWSRSGSFTVMGAQKTRERASPLVGYHFKTAPTCVGGRVTSSGSPQSSARAAVSTLEDTISVLFETAF